MADFSQSRINVINDNPNLTQEQKDAEKSKWEEGGIYRVALYTATGLLATETIEGGLSAGTTAYTIPKIDEYLTNQGFNKETRDITLLALSAGLGAGIGDSTASTANNVGQTEGNYLSHVQFRNKILCIREGLGSCAEYDKISKEQDERLRATCSSNPNNVECHRMMREALEYVGQNRNHYGKTSDIQDSTKRVLNVANYVGYHTIDTLDERANYFGAMYGYTGQPWFREAESESRSFLSLKGADKSFYSDWIAETGGVIMRNGRSEFQYIYNNHVGQSNSWS